MKNTFQLKNFLDTLLNQSAKIRKGGNQLLYHCVKCHHRKKKLEFCTEINKYGVFKCWVCNFSGNLYTILKFLNADKSWYDKMDLIISDSNKNRYKNAFDDMFDAKEKMVSTNTLPEGFKQLNESNKSIDYKHAIHYLQSRGITECDIYRYNIGYCDIGDYRNRIIIPSYDHDGNLNFFSGRDFYNTSWLKYVNCKFSKNIIGFEILTDFSDEITLVEGSFDAIAVRKNCIPLFGKTLSQRLKIKLLENKPPYVNILLDNDALKDSIGICEFLIKNGINTRLVKLEEKDPSILGFDKTWEYINNTKPITFDELFRLKINL